MQYNNGAVRYMHKALELTISGSLRLVGHAIGLPWEFRLFSQLVEECEPEYLMLPISFNIKDKSCYLIWDVASDEIVMGMVIFDGDPIFHAKYVLIASQERVPKPSP